MTSRKNSETFFMGEECFCLGGFWLIVDSKGEELKDEKWVVDCRIRKERAKQNKNR